MGDSGQLQLCLVDMNNGHENQAIRCFKKLLDNFTARVKESNPALAVTLAHVQPRNLEERAPLTSDIILSSGGPGSPLDGFDDPWCVGWRGLVDHVVTQNLRHPRGAPSMLNVCHSFEMAAHHLKVGTLQPRDRRKFGVMPVYPTAAGQADALMQEFGDRLFAFEHRSWEVVNAQEPTLAGLGGEVLALESRDGHSKGKGITAFRFAHGVYGTIFHPEADRAGMVAWINKPEMAAAFKDAYGEETYDQMMDTVNDPTRVARTFSLFIPGFLVNAFNALCPARGWRTLSPTVQDPSQFEHCPA